MGYLCFETLPNVPISSHATTWMTVARASASCENLPNKQPRRCHKTDGPTSKKGARLPSVDRRKGVEAVARREKQAAAQCAPRFFGLCNNWYNPMGVLSFWKARRLARFLLEGTLWGCFDGKHKDTAHILGSRSYLKREDLP